MYLIELIVKKFFNREEKQKNNPPNNISSEDYENCEHIFMPVDSTNEILACTKCGFLVKKKDLKNKNFFLNEN